MGRVSLVLGFIYLIVGFWKRWFYVFVGLGYLWGWRLDRREDMEKVVSAILGQVDSKVGPGPGESFGW